MSAGGRTLASIREEVPERHQTLSSLQIKPLWFVYFCAQNISTSYFDKFTSRAAGIQLVLTALPL